MKRDKKIDILRVIGLFCIILAHTNPPRLMIQLRSFDVILMIIISAYLVLGKETKLTIKSYMQYIWKRIKRLVFPTWIFLSFYFAVMFLVKHPISIRTMFDSYILNNGIGYVWIIRIYLIAAIVLPLLQYFLDKNCKLTYIVMIMLYILYEIMCSFGIFDRAIMNYLFAYIIPIAFIICVTHWIKNNKSKKIVLFSIINFMICLILAYIIYRKTGEIQTTNYMKYPFRLYYLSYAFAISGILMIIFRNEKITNSINNKFIEFVSMHSLWIYLWHIIFIKIFDAINYHINWFIKFVIASCGALFITYIQNKIINYLESKKINKEILAIFKG